MIDNREYLELTKEAEQEHERDESENKKGYKEAKLNDEGASFQAQDKQKKGQDNRVAGELVLSVDFAPPQLQASQPSTSSVTDSQVSASWHFVELSICIRGNNDEIASGGGAQVQGAGECFNSDEQRERSEPGEREGEGERGGEREEKEEEGEERENGSPQGRHSEQSSIWSLKGDKQSSPSHSGDRLQETGARSFRLQQSQSQQQSLSQTEPQQWTEAKTTPVEEGNKKKLVYQRLDRIRLRLSQLDDIFHNFRPAQQLSSSSTSVGSKHWRSSDGPGGQGAPVESGMGQRAQPRLPLRSSSFDNCFCFNLLNVRVTSRLLLELEEKEERQEGTNSEHEDYERCWIKSRRLTSEFRRALLNELARVVKPKGEYHHLSFAKEES